MTAGALLLAATLAGSRPVRLSDLGPAVRSRLAERATTPTAFDDYVRELDRQTAERERDGEWDHLIHYLLQSRRFTGLPRVEPAESAREFASALEPAVRAAYLDGRAPPITKVPASVRQRLAAFEAALEGRTIDVRLAWFRSFLASVPSTGARTGRVLAEYARVMRFLYLKEFAAPSTSDPQAQAEFVAGLYRERGHSTDTQVESGFAVHQALGVIRAETGHGPLGEVLIVGPGLDFAPRTGLVDLFPPQSYQPFAVADGLLGLGLTTAERLRLHCVDINERVVAHLRALPRGEPTRLSLLSGVAERAARPFSADYREYFDRLGKSVGREGPLALPPGFESYLRKRLDVRPEIAARIKVDLFDIVTRRYDPPPCYDLVVVTNVFSYFGAGQQALALANIEAMLRPEGYLIHNEPQTQLVAAAEALGLRLVQARTVLLAAHAESPLFDRVLVHRKRAR